MKIYLILNEVYTVNADEEDNPDANGTFPVNNIFNPLNS
jgi:hypothetical protein